MQAKLVATIPVDDLLWLPVGPPEDLYSRLMCGLLFGDCPMTLHAVEVLVDRNDVLISKAQDHEHVLLAIEMVEGGAERFHTCTIQGRSYLLCAMPHRRD